MTDATTNYQAVIQSQNGPDGGWLDYCREQITKTSSAEAARAQAAHFIQTARRGCPNIAFRARIESWGIDTLNLHREVIDNPHAIAAEFCAILERDLTPEQMADVRKRNDPDASWCPTHDHCDANMLMAEAWATVTGYDFLDDNGDTDEAQRRAGIWNEAWDAARQSGFDMRAGTRSHD